MKIAARNIASLPPVYEYVRNKRGEKKRYPTFLDLELGIAEENDCQTRKSGMKMTVTASTKNMQPEEDTLITFRVNQFDFGCLDKD